MIDLNPEHLNAVKEIVRRRLPEATVWVFGSRVSGKAKPYSDLDLALIAERPIDGVLMAELAEDFTESDLPIRVDMVDWAATDPAFQNVIQARYEPLFSA